MQESLFDPAREARRFTEGVHFRRMRQRHGTLASSGSGLIQSGDDLLVIPPPEYVEALTRKEVPANGFIECPFHDERTGSFKAYPTAERGWYCFGCGEGGSIYNLASKLWGVDNHGAEFFKLQEMLAELFG